MKIKRNDEVTGYKLDFATGTLTINYKFAKALSDYGSPEYLRYKAILADFPDLKVIRKAGRTVTSTRPNKRLTYENMERHIKAYENADELLDVFETVKAASVPLASPYKYVCDWFKAQFPDYKNAVVFNDGKLTVIPQKAPDTKEYKQKLPKVG